MSLSDLFIRRPVLSTVVACMMLLLGFQGIFNLSIRQYPKVDETAITITTAYPGASADLIQGFVSAPIARAVASTENIDFVTSASRPSSSTVVVQMKLGSNPDVALTEVLSKVQGVRGTLPEEAKDPVIVKGTGQDFAMMYLSMQNPNMTPEQLTEYIERVVRPTMSTVEGVADVQIFGAADYSMRVWIDPIKLAARGVTASDVLVAINNSNFLSAPGNTENEYVVSSITVRSTLQTPEAFAALPLRSTDGNVVRLRDVARVELAAENTDTRVSFNGKPGTFLAIFPTPAANPLTTAEAIHAIVPSIQATLPQGMTIEIVYDSTEQISASIEEVFKTIAEAVAIVVVVILLFLGSFRSVLMPIATIPLSLIGVCFLLFAVGYSINLLSLLAMVLAIGLVVDDAIVVVENIHRHMEEDHMSPMQAALSGMREISSAIVAMTLTLAAVFAPLAFTGGLTGALFREFAVTLAGAVVISGIVAITITPMMSARILKAGAPGRFQRIVDGTFQRVEGLYGRLVTAVVEVPSGDADDRHRAGRPDRLHVPENLERVGAGRGPGLPAVAGHRAALRDIGLYRNLRQSDARTGRGHPGDAGAVLGSRLRWCHQQRLRGLRLQGLGRTHPQLEGAPGGYPGPHLEGGRGRGFRLRTPDAAGLGRRPADHHGGALDGRGLRSVRGGRADQEQGAGLGAFYRRPEFHGL